MIDIKQQVKNAIQRGKSIRIGYRKFDGEVSRRIVSDIDYNNSFTDDGFYNDHIKGFCHLRYEERTFKISRIISIEIV